MVVSARVLVSLGLASSIALGGLVGCSKEGEKKPPAQTGTASSDAPKPVKPAPTTTQAAAPKEACIKPFGAAGIKRKFDAGGKTYVITGSLLTQETKDNDDEITFGVMANVKENTPENLANIDALLAHFKKEKVEAIIVNGDLGESQQQIEAVLDRIAAAKLLTLVIIGNREGVKPFDAAVEAATNRFPGFVNMNYVRLSNLEDAAILSLPGYYNRVYIHAPDGCEYKPEDVESMRLFMEHADGRPIVMVSHGPPRQEGADALDRTLEQVNVGDPALANFLRETDIHFGVFANIHESGGRATDVTGTKLVPHGKMVDELFMNPGPVDAVRWKMNDGTESVGMGGILTIKGKQGTFKIHRLKS